MLPELPVLPTIGGSLKRLGKTPGGLPSARLGCLSAWDRITLISAHPFDGRTITAFRWSIHNPMCVFIEFSFCLLVHQDTVAFLQWVALRWFLHDSDASCPRMPSHRRHVSLRICSGPAMDALVILTQDIHGLSRRVSMFSSVFFPWPRVLIEGADCKNLFRFDGAGMLTPDVRVTRNPASSSTGVCAAGPQTRRALGIGAVAPAPVSATAPYNIFKPCSAPDANRTQPGNSCDATH